MLYEVRVYAIAPGRSADIARRMLADVPPLFAAHGLRACAHWHVIAGPGLPAFVYVLHWRDAAERDAAWARFYADARWWDIRARTNAGSELVEHYGLWLMKPFEECGAPLQPVACAHDGEVHEMALHFVPINRRAALAAHLRTVAMPGVARAGGRVLGVLETVAGPRVPSIALFTAWPDGDAWRSWRTASSAVPTTSDGAGPDLLGRADVHLMQPARSS